MTGPRSERLTLFDFDDADDLAATVMIVDGVRSHRDAWAEGAAAHA
jgi:hypothetical protein